MLKLKLQICLAEAATHNLIAFRQFVARAVGFTVLAVALHLDRIIGTRQTTVTMVEPIFDDSEFPTMVWVETC